MPRGELRRASAVKNIPQSGLYCSASHPDLRLCCILAVLRNEEAFVGSPLTEMRCVLCGKPVDLGCDLVADEDGQAVHEECYIKRIKSDAHLSDKVQVCGAR